MLNTSVSIYVLSHLNDSNQIQQCLEQEDKKKYNVKHKFFSNSLSCANAVIEFEPDIIFIDNHFFESFLKSLAEIKSKESIFTHKRFVVFTLQNEFTEDRLIELSLFNVRSTFSGIENFSQALISNYTQIQKFHRSHPKTSLCMSGGGIDGYLYALGVCRGLEMCLEDFHANDFDIFCGVSSGSILACSFAGGFNAEELVEQAYKKHPKLEPITVKMLFDFAFLDFIKHTFSRKTPLGIFKGEKFKKFFAKQISNLNLNDNLEDLKKSVFIFATNQDTGEAIVLGQEPWKKNIKISQAVRASIALPPFYLPEKINGHWCTDGQLATSTNFDLPIHDKGSLMVVIDPIVAFSTSRLGGVKKRGGYFTVLQAIKNLIHSRSAVALQHARDKHPDVDFIKFQPTHQIMEIMAGNPMHIPIRTKLIELSAKATCEQILERYEEFEHKFSKHNLALKPKEIIAKQF